MALAISGKKHICIIFYTNKFYQFTHIYTGSVSIEKYLILIFSSHSISFPLSITLG